MDRPTIYGLIGFPLGHSFSQEFFTGEFSRLGINARYLNFEIEDIGKLMEIVAEYPELRGLNVTTPYKRQVLPYIDSLSGEARAIGAVNVVKIIGSDPDLIFEGHNTDALGFAMDLKEKLVQLPVMPTGALVLGSGGASAAVCYGLRTLGITPTVVSRNPQAPGMISYSDVTGEVVARNTVIVNATPLGMPATANQAPPFPYHLITPDHLCYDLIYNPSPTRFMTLCKRQGAAVSDGLGMLKAQARLSWEIWTGQEL